jgi:hypothetical protein
MWFFLRLDRGLSVFVAVFVLHLQIEVAFIIVEEVRVVSLVVREPTSNVRRRQAA